MKISDDGWKAVVQIGVVRCSSDFNGSGVMNSEASAVGDDSEELEYRLTIPVVELPSVLFATKSCRARLTQLPCTAHRR